MCASKVIRSLTFGLPYDKLGSDTWQLVREIIIMADALFKENGWQVRTRRLVLPPLDQTAGIDVEQALPILGAIRKYGESAGIRWFCVPFSGDEHKIAHELRKLGPRIAHEEPLFFLHYLLAHQGTVFCNAFSEVASYITQIGRISNNGFDNFRVGAGFNISENTPFFPFSWHKGCPAFTLAVESLHVALGCLASVYGSVSIRDALVQSLSALCAEADGLAKQLAHEFKPDITYKGLDISFAPYPNATDSIANLLAKLGIGSFGTQGMSTATAFLTSILKEAVAISNARAIGFNGVMYSPLEDAGIAKSLQTYMREIDSFLLWSTVCGCGIDMIPIPGDTGESSIAALYADVATLSNRFNKPLGVRLLPIPGLRVNQLTRFNHDFLVNCPVFDLRGTAADFNSIGCR